MKEHQGERKGQYANAGEHPQRLTTALMHRWFFEVPFGGHGLEHFAIDNPTTTTQLMDEHGRNGTQLQVAFRNSCSSPELFLSPYASAPVRRDEPAGDASRCCVRF